jgi:hypothetical protein
MKYTTRFFILLIGYNCWHVLPREKYCACYRFFGLHPVASTFSSNIQESKAKEARDNQRKTDSLDEYKPAYCHMAVVQQWMRQNLVKCLKILGDKPIRPYFL